MSTLSSLLDRISHTVAHARTLTDTQALYDTFHELNKLALEGKVHTATVLWEQALPERTVPRTVASPPRMRSADDLLSDL